MWWITQILAVLAVACVHTFNRWAGLKGWGFIPRVIFNVLGQSIAAPLFMLSYKLAPSFVQVSFLGTALVGVFMFLGAILFFGESISLLHMIGLILAIVGALLLTL